MSESTVPPGAVVITAKEMYELVVETRDEVRSLKDIFSPAINEVRTDVSDLRTENRVLAARVTALERFKWVLVGVGAAFGGGLGGIVSAVIK